MAIYPIALNALGNKIEIDPVALTSTLADTTALAAYDGAITTIITADGNCWKRDATAVGPADGYFTVACATGGWWRLVHNNMICVKQHGKAVGNGNADDYAAIQRCIDFAKSLSAMGGGTFRATIQFPPGFYYITQSLNCTNTNGITLLGTGGQYINSGIIGNTNRAGSGPMMIDFSGSSMSGAQDLGLYGFAGYGATMSTIGFFFGLTSSGGLRCFTRNVFTKLEDNSTAHGGWGTIGLVSIRAEESQFDGIFSANVGMLLTNNNNIGDTGKSHTFTSPYATLSTGYGSEGVFNLSGSLVTYEKRSPALILNGTNAVKAHLYIGCEKAGASWLGTEESAILFTQATYSPIITGTIEGYARAFKTGNILQGADINVNVANVVNPTTEIINVTGATINTSRITISLPNTTERSSSTLLYHDPGTGDAAVSGSVRNSVISCAQIANNQLAISKGLLRNTDNTVFNVGQPFERKGGAVRTLFQNSVTAGNGAAPVAATVMRFNQADRTTTGSGNGGYYSIKVEGIICAGSYSSGGKSVQRFQASITQNQDQNSGMSVANSTVTVLERSQTNAGFVTVTGLSIALSYSSGIGSIVITPVASGASELLTIRISSCEIVADFAVNHPCLFA